MPRGGSPDCRPRCSAPPPHSASLGHRRRLPTQRPLGHRRGLLKMPLACPPLSSGLSALAHRSWSHPASQRGPRGACSVVCHPPAPADPLSPRPLSQPLASSPVAPLHFQVLAALLPFTCHFCLGDGHPPSRHPLGLSEVLLPRGGGGGVSGPPSGGDAIPVPCVPVASVGPVLLLHGVHGA